MRFLQVFQSIASLFGYNKVQSTKETKSCLGYTVGMSTASGQL